MTLPAFSAPAAVVLTVAGIVFLRSAWKRPGRWFPVAAGWLSLAAAALGWLGVAAADKAVTFGLLAPSPIAFVVIAGGANVRRKTKRRPARGTVPSVELTAGRANIWRGLSRTALAGPASLLPALSVSVLVALKAPFGDAARLIAAGLLLPALWAAFMTWALYDSRLDRVFAALIMVALVGGVGTFL